MFAADVKDSKAVTDDSNTDGNPESGELVETSNSHDSAGKDDTGDIVAKVEAKTATEVAAKAPVSLPKREEFPSSYWSTSQHDLRVVSHVQNFRRQFALLFPQRRELFLMPENEFGIPKLVCSTIRPTKLAHRELQDYHTCARFVAEYVAFMPLEHPFDIVQEGTSFDMSVLLCSILRGAGFNAYVVSGYAFRQFTLQDETNVDADVSSLLVEHGFTDPMFSYASSPTKPAQSTSQTQSSSASSAIGSLAAGPANLNVGLSSSLKESSAGGTHLGNSVNRDHDKEEFNLVGAPGETSSPTTTSQVDGQKVKPGVSKKYRARPRANLQSRFQAQRKALEAQMASAKFSQQESKLKSDSVKEKDNELDKFAGLRVHAWVLVLPGKRDISEPFFIESTTGKVYDIGFQGYSGIESVFSPANYWVNMQTCRHGLRGLSYDLGNVVAWEYLFACNTLPALSQGFQRYDDAVGNAGSKLILNLQQQQPQQQEQPQASETQGQGVTAMPQVASNIENIELNNDDGKPLSAKDHDDPYALTEAPPSWVAPLDVTRQQLESRCPATSKVILWRNVKLELFAEYKRTDGMVARLVQYEASSQGDSVGDGVIYERYEHRKDLLWMRVLYPQQGKAIEQFLRGRAHGLAEHVVVDKSSLCLKFFRGSRGDGMIERNQTNNKIVELYEGREDRLYKRKVIFLDSIQNSTTPNPVAPSRPPKTELLSGDHQQAKQSNTAKLPVVALETPEQQADGVLEEDKLQQQKQEDTQKEKRAALDSAEVQITKITEYYERRNGPLVPPPGCSSVDLGPGDESLPVHCDEIRKRVFDIGNDQICIVYHAPRGCLVPSWREFRKPTADQNNVQFTDLMTSFDPHPKTTVGSAQAGSGAKRKMRRQHMYARLCELLRAEQASLAAIAANDREAQLITSSRRAEEAAVQLQVSMFDTTRNQTDVMRELERESQRQAEEASRESAVDYLSPFLVAVLQSDERSDGRDLTRTEALAVRDACMRAMRERLANRGHLIQRRYDEESARYQAKQQYFSKNSETMTTQETGEYVHFCNDAMFRINVLEHRLSAHKENTLRMLGALEAKLRDDPRLARHLASAAPSASSFSTTGASTTAAAAAAAFFSSSSSSSTAAMQQPGSSASSTSSLAHARLPSAAFPAASHLGAS